MRKLTFFLLITAIIIFSFRQKTDSKMVTLSGNITNYTTGKIVISTLTFPVTKAQTLAEIIPDSLGNFKVTFPLESPVEAALSYGQQGLGIFLKPEYNLTLTFNAEEFNQSIHYKGTGALINNFLVKRYLTELEIRGKFNRELMSKEPEAFISALSKMERNTKKLLRKTKLKGIEQTYAETDILCRKFMDYVKYPKAYKYHNKKAVDLPEDYGHYWTTIQWPDEKMLDLSRNYRDLVYRYAQKLVIDHKGQSFKLSSPNGLNEIIKITAQMPKLHKDYVKAHAIAEILKRFGIDLAKPHMQAYLASSPKASWKDNLYELYQKWEPLAKGNPAPALACKSPKGEVVSLTSLKGKMVYIDVWATWCRPCIREIPKAKEMKEAFKGKDVAFLYISVDENLTAWKKFLAKDSDFSNAIHAATYTGWKSELSEKYLIQSIPRYFLIDKEGNIISANAPRPSSKEIIPMIEAALKGS